MIEIFTAAVGAKYQAMALDMSRSFISHGWPKLTILTESWIDGCKSNQIVRPSNFAGGRDLKTSFANFASNDTENAWWIDCDCLATGPALMPIIDKGEVMGRILTRMPSWMGGLAHIAGTVVGIGGLSQARDICKTWNERHKIRPFGTSDEVALFEAIAKFKVSELGGSYSSPLPNLIHLGATSAERNKSNRKVEWILSKPNIHP